MTPEQKARIVIDNKLKASGWVVQDRDRLDLSIATGVAVREFPTSTGPADYILFIDGKPVGVIEAKKTDAGEWITSVEGQSARYANSKIKWMHGEYHIRFAYEATDKIVRFTDYKDIKYRSRTVFSFHRPETLKALLEAPDTIRNNMKKFPPLDETGFRHCQITAIRNLDQSFADNRPRALVQMATGAGKTYTAITAAYRLLKYGKMNRILFLVDTRSLGEQAEREFLAYKPNDDTRNFSQLYGVRRLKSSYIPNDIQVCISTIQRMYSILKGTDIDESLEETSFAEFDTADTKPQVEVVYNEKYPPEFFDCIIVDECHRSIYNVWSQVLTYFDAQETVDYYGNIDDVAICRFVKSEDDEIHSALTDVEQIDTPVNGSIEKIVLVNENQQIFADGVQTYDVWLTRGVIFTVNGREISFEKQN